MLSGRLIESRSDCIMLIEKLTKYFINREEVIAVYLFGSYAEGREGPLSDVDIGILITKNDRSFSREKRNRYMIELAKILRKDIHPVILNSASEELMRQIFLKGKCILINDSKKLSRYKMVTMSKIAEFAQYRGQMQLGLIKKVMEG